MRRIVLFETDRDKEEKRELVLVVKDNSDIVMDGCDNGPFGEEYYGERTLKGYS